ncbi:MAG: hypothetical protein AN484_17740 [Aphanizomenon flos-aquae WA102]|uniref:Uncharacterized protein n=1 Tax=Aphanizomenon flos-aquae WA102 TaxID=1710896 RepID=A0A1B7WZ99_APHFL|nr:MAG: hypothetical protein AN484_17740 [Aphanizomenon flos-aquae WA102]
MIQIDINEEEKMFKINAQDLHFTIQKKLNKILGGSLVDGIIATGINPDELDWEETEIEIYGSIDFDCDRLSQCVSWGEEKQEQLEVKDALLSDIKNGFNKLDDWHKYQTRGAWGFFGSGLSSGISYYIHELDRKYCGQVFKATGRDKEVATYDQMDGFGFADSVDKHVYTKYEYKHSDGTIIWVTENKKTYTIPTEQEVVGRIQVLIYEHCKREKMTWELFVSDIENRKQKNAAFDAADLAARQAAIKAAESAIPMPEWFQKEVYSKGSVNRFWIGDDYIYSFWWDTQDGTVWQQCEDRTRGLAERTRKSKSLGSDRDEIMNHINSLLAERRRASELLAQQEEIKQQQEKRYDEYRHDQKIKNGVVKPFEKWLKQESREGHKV